MNNIIRGTTPIHVFNIDQDLRNCRVYVTYSQKRNIVFERTNDSIQIDENSIKLQLTQEETLALLSDIDVQIQIRYTDGINAGASEVLTVNVHRVLKDGEI